MSETLRAGRSKKAGQQAVETLLNARKQRDVLEKRVEKLEDEVAKGRATAAMRVDLQLYEDQMTELKEKIAQRERELGRVSNFQLSLVRNSKFFDLRMTARVLKGRLRNRIIQRKMEFARIERPLRTQANGMSMEYISKCSVAEHIVSQNDDLTHT